MNKRLFAVFVFSLVVTTVLAQDEDEKKGFDANRMFIGSGVNLGFSNGFIIGLNPEFGYSLNKVMDIGIATNLTYVTQRYQSVNITARYLALGGGPFCGSGRSSNSLSGDNLSTTGSHIVRRPLPASSIKQKPKRPVCWWVSGMVQEI